MRDPCFRDPVINLGPEAGELHRGHGILDDKDSVLSETVDLRSGQCRH